ncbi:hypothetical protein DDE82_002162 [Stemphylium lycopersici]|nr:hypothetical protein TW65_06850 [Stemphylium lycopersici]RAR08546.1 hypothetical protein DDE82_002162 [Stemphylium lycopersici]
MAPAAEEDASTTVETEAVHDAQDTKPEQENDLQQTASWNPVEVKKTGADNIQLVDEVQPIDQKQPVFEVQPVDTPSLDPAEDEEYDSGASSDEDTLSSDGSDNENVSDPEYGEPYGFGPARDRDQSNAWIPNISAEDEAAAEIGLMARDDAFDTHFNEYGIDAVYEDMGIASNSDDSESEAERKRDERSKVENSMDAYEGKSAQGTFLKLLSQWSAPEYRDTQRERACLLVVRSHRLLLHVLLPLTDNVIATKHSAAPQNTSSPLTDFNHTCPPTTLFSPTTSPIMSDILSEKASFDVSSDATTQSQQFQDQLEAILRKLKSDASSITADEARLLSENVTTSVHHQGSSYHQAPHRSLLTAAKDLHAAVDGSPEEVTTEVLRTAQSIVSKMQKAVGHNNAPQPEVEAKLQEEIAKIEPKIAQGTVTKAEADRLHSLEARAHGHTEKGGIAAAAQSVVARRERQLSLSGSSGAISSLNNGRSRANSRNFTAPHQQSQRDQEKSLDKAEVVDKSEIEQGANATTGNATLNSGKTHAHEDAEKSELSATAQPFVSEQRQTLSDVSNSAHFSNADAKQSKEQPQNDKEPKKAEEELMDAPETKNEAR